MFKSFIDAAFFCYAASGTVPLNSSLEPAINFSNDSDFVLQEIRNKNQAAGAITIVIKLSGGEAFSNQALDASIFGQGNDAIKFFREIKIPANSQLNILMTNTTGADIVHEIQFWGYKVPKKG